MMPHQIRLKILPWDDRIFTSSVESLVHEIESGGSDIDSPVAAEYAQHRLREGGWPRAVIAYHRNVDEALRHVAHWVVYRERTD